jgi:hypothetical protein
MTSYEQTYADRSQAASSASALRIPGRTEAAVAGAVRTLKLTVANALYAYAVTGSAFATLLVLAAPHLEVFIRCFFHDKG